MAIAGAASAVVSDAHRPASSTEAFDDIEIFYNATRRHSTLGMLSPARCEENNDSLKQLNDINND